MVTSSKRLYGNLRILLSVAMLTIGLFHDSFATNSDNWLTVKLLNNNENINYQEFTVSIKVNEEWQTKTLNMPLDGDASSLQTKFALGNEEMIDELKIIWPSKEAQILNGVKANQTIAVAKPKFPNPPSNVFARVINNNQIDLVWKDNSDNELGFSIERSLFSDKGFEQVGKVAANKNIFSDKTVEANTTYYYRVRAISENGYSFFDGAYQKTEENTGLVMEDLNQPLRMYPNPSKDFLDVRVNNSVMGDVIVKFMDNNGKELKSLTFKKSIKDLKRKVDISKLPFGVYMVEVSLVAYRSLFKNS